MVASSTLRTLDACDWALVLAVEDLPYAWTTHEDLVGTSVFADGRTVLQGLHFPTYSMGVDPLSDWQFKRAPVTITLDDFGGELATLLSTFDGEEVPLFPSVYTTDSLAARTELHGKQVGNEAIGSSGGRNAHPVIESFSRPRIHVGEDCELPEIGHVAVTDLPVVLEGRRVVLYRVYRDVVTYPDSYGFATWRALSEADQAWWGTLRKAGHSVDGRTWALDCAGPESWVYKRLGNLTQEQRCRVLVPLALDTTDGTDQSLAYLKFSSTNETGTTSVYGIDNYGSAFTGTDTLTLRGELRTMISDAAAATGAAGIFTDFYEHAAGLDDATGAIWIRVDDIASPNQRNSRLTLSLHYKVWLALGFDIVNQSRFSADDEFWIDAQPVEADAPGPGYYEATLSTRAVGGDFVGEDADYANGGKRRYWKPLYAAGTMTIPNDLETTPLEIQLVEDSAYHSGQFDRAPMADPTDSSAAYPIGAGVNRQGLWILNGPRRFAAPDGPLGEPDDTFDEAQVVHTSWREAGLDLARVLGDPPTMVAKRFERPRNLGIDRGTISSPWLVLQNDAENTVYATPILRLGYGDVDGEDQAHIVIQRLLYSTGKTAGWSGFDGGTPTLAATTNEPSGAGLGARLDGEHEDLACQIPQPMIAAPDTWQTAADRLSSTLRKVSLVIRPGMETESLLRGLMTPRGWGWSLDGGKYGLLDFSSATTPENGTILDWSTKATDDKLQSHKTNQELRAFAPKDRYVLKYDWNPLTQEFTKEADMRSPDKGSRYRPYPYDRPDASSRLQGSSTHTVEAHGTRTAGGWRGRMSKVAKWYDRGQYWIRKYPLTRVPGFDIWPGTKVVMTEPRAVGSDGTYGIVGAVGLVTDVHFVDGGKSITCDILVDASSRSQIRFCAPSARARGYDTSTRKLHCEDDHLGHGEDKLDVSAFVEPSWSNLGGDAIVQIHQWDGYAWTITATGTVEAVDETPGSTTITITSGGLTGTYRRDDDAIITLAPMDDQTAAWVLALFAPICDEDGQWNTPDEYGPRWA